MFAEEILKFQLLYKHYKHHKQEHHDSTKLLNFLITHYKGEADKQEKHEEEKGELPFKHSSHGCINIHVSVLALLPTSIDLNQEQILKKISSYFIKNDNISDTSFSSIWQPKKI